MPLVKTCTSVTPGNRQNHLSEWTDEARQTDNAAVSKQFRDFGDAANVLLSILWTKAKALVDSMTNVVRVQTVR